MANVGPFTVARAESESESESESEIGGVISRL